jgi:hypothetical protein
MINLRITLVLERRFVIASAVILGVLDCVSQLVIMGTWCSWLSRSLSISTVCERCWVQFPMCPKLFQTPDWQNSFEIIPLSDTYLD